MIIGLKSWVKIFLVLEFAFLFSSQSLGMMASQESFVEKHAKAISLSALGVKTVIESIGVWQAIEHFRATQAAIEVSDPYVKSNDNSTNVVFETITNDLRTARVGTGAVIGLEGLGATASVAAAVTLAFTKTWPRYVAISFFATPLVLFFDFFSNYHIWKNLSYENMPIDVTSHLRKAALSGIYTLADSALITVVFVGSFCAIYKRMKREHTVPRV